MPLSSLCAHLRRYVTSERRPFRRCYLSVERFERLLDLLPLGVGSSGQHVDDGLFVGTESFHCGPEHGRVRVGVEVVGRADRGYALGRAKKKTRYNWHPRRGEYSRRRRPSILAIRFR